MFTAKWIAEKSLWILKQCFTETNIQANLLGRGLAYFLPEENLPLMMGILALALPEAAKGLIQGVGNKPLAELALSPKSTILNIEASLSSYKLANQTKKHQVFKSDYEKKGSQLLKLQKNLFASFQQEPTNMHFIKVHAELAQIIIDNASLMDKHELAFYRRSIIKIEKAINKLNNDNSINLWSFFSNLKKIKEIESQIPKESDKKEMEEICSQSENFKSEIDILFYNKFNQHIKSINIQLELLQDEIKKALQQQEVDKNSVYESALPKFSSFEFSAKDLLESVLNYQDVEFSDESLQLNKIINKITTSSNQLRKLCGLPKEIDW